jgi:ABC-type nitrate/sulfonate/bicarbonate transport system permease component
LFNTRSGVTEVEPGLVDAARVSGLSRAAIIRRVVLPSALPAIATGLRIAVTIALALTIIAEMTGSGDGLGYYILSSGQGGNYEPMYVGVIVASLLGAGLPLLLHAAERRVLHWNVAYRD